MSGEAGRAVERGLIALLAFGILAFGSTPYWARAILQAGTAILFVAWWLHAAGSRLPLEFEPAQWKGVELGGVRFRSSGVGIPAVLFGAIVLFQLVPLPAWVRLRLAPRLETLEVPPAAVLGTAAGDIGEAAPEGWRPLSLDAGATLDSLLLYLGYAALFLVVYNLVDSRRRLIRICRLLVAFAFFVALVGLFQDLAGLEKIYGFRSLRYGGSLFGPFVNHNHFAGFMELTIPLTVGLLLRRLLGPSSAEPGPWSENAPSRTTGSGRLPIGGSPRGERAGQAILLVLALAVMVAALLLSRSRGGLAALALASGAMMVLLALRGKLGRWELAVLAAAVAAGLALFLWIGPGPMLEHFRSAEGLQHEPSIRSRALVWKATLGIVRDFPVFGAGLGGFPAAFLHYYPAGTERIWRQAHNDYVQLLAETGLVGSLLAAVGFLILVSRLAGPLVARRGVGERYVYYGLCTGILALLLHSLVDFNLHVPGNASFFVVLCALALSQRSLLRRSGKRRA